MGVLPTLQLFLLPLGTQLWLPFRIRLSMDSNLAAVCLEADIDIPQIAMIKEILADPSKFAAAAAPVAAAEAEAPKEEEKKEESEGNLMMTWDSVSLTRNLLNVSLLGQALESIYTTSNLCEISAEEFVINI